LNSAGLKKLNEALKAAGLFGMTQRHSEMQRASAVYWGLQYDGLPKWHDPKASALPIRQKAPALQYRLTYRAVNEIGAYLFGKGRKPTPQIEGEATDEAQAALQKFYNSASGGTGIRHHLGELGRLALLHGQAAIAFHKRTFGGVSRYSTEVIDTRMSKPTFGRDRIEEAVKLGIDDDELIELDEYWYTVEFDPSGEEIIWLHRRLWEIGKTTEFKPLSLDEKLEWVEDKERTVAHGLQFITAEWVWNSPVANDIDGAPLLSEAEFSLEDSVNYTMSQIDRGIAYNQEPLTVFLGPNLQSGSEIKRGAGNTVQLPRDPSGGVPEAKMLEISGGGQKTAMEWVRMVRGAFYEIAQIVMHDPQQAMNVMSGTALERMMYPTIAQVDKIRPNYGRGISRLLRKMLQAEGLGLFDVMCAWPAIIEPSAVDILQAQTATIQARDAGVITQKTTIERTAPFYGVEDVEAYRAEVQAEEVSGGTVSREDDFKVEGI